MHPDKANIVILTTHETQGCYLGRFEAFIAEDRSQGNKIFMKSSSIGSHEGALRLLLYMTTTLMKKMLEGQPVELPEVKPFVQSTANGNGLDEKETAKGVNELEQSPEQIKMKRFHNALGHVIDLAARK